MLKIPVVKDFDSSQVIGYLFIDPKALPKQPNYNFNIGYILGKDFGNNEYTLVCVSPVEENNQQPG